MNSPPLAVRCTVFSRPDSGLVDGQQRHIRCGEDRIALETELRDLEPAAECGFDAFPRHFGLTFALTQHEKQNNNLLSAQARATSHNLL